MSMEKKKSDFLDYERFGEILRGVRIASGYETADELLNDVELKTGYKMSKVSFYRIERGERALPLEAYLAFQEVMPRFFNAEMNKRGKIYDERYYRKDWCGRRCMTQYSGNKTIEHYKLLRDRVNRNCKWEHIDLIRAEKQLEEAMKNLERAKARLANAEASNKEDLAKIDEILKAAGVRH